MKKQDSSKQPNSRFGFWFCAGLIVILLASTMAREIDRPFSGLHSWAQASGAWVARSHVKYGLGYTKGVSTWAVGEPPAENPKRYWDHPQLSGLIKAGAMAIFGIEEWVGRAINLTISVAALLIFFKILKGLFDEKTALLAGLFAAIFPLCGYFGFTDWAMTWAFSGIWFYLVVIGALKNGPQASKWHKIFLAVSLFLAVQFGWAGFFWCFAIGFHYVCWCVLRRQGPNKVILAILIAAPFLSLALNFTVMAGGYGWDFSKVMELYKWRSAKGEMQEFLWGAWFAKLWEFAGLNFTLPVLIIAIGYLTVGQLYVLLETTPAKDDQPSRVFNCFILFAAAPVAQLLVLKGALWKHQTWERPLMPLIAISAGLGVLVLGDIIKKVRPRVAAACMVMLVGLSFIYCIGGTNYYYAVRWQAEAKIDMFKMLNSMIPPDKYLLSFEDFIVNQHKSKGGFYRPEIAWYLDREITPAKSLNEIQQYAQTGKYPYYLIPQVKELAPLMNQLAQVYEYQFVAGQSSEKDKKGRFLKAGVYPYVIFNLNSKVAN